MANTTRNQNNQSNASCCGSAKSSECPCGPGCACAPCTCGSFCNCNKK